MDSRGDQHTTAADDGKTELELGERSNAASTIPPVVLLEQEAPTTAVQQRRGRARRLIRRLNPAAVARACLRWLKHPAHLAFVAWAVCVAGSGIMLGLLLLGALNEAFPRKSVRNRWIEINNQILNALFTLMSFYQHPALFHHAVLLLRWRPGDEKALRKAYCRKIAGVRGGRPGRLERVHMAVVVALLHVTCFAQYAMCGLYWGFDRKTRPDDVETTLMVVGIAVPVLAGLYMYFSPLGRKGDPSPGVHHQEEPADVEVVIGGAAAVEWDGGLLDVRDDPTACWLSCFCTFCVFGWNMDRLGLGNMYVHTVMFALLCFAPLWVLNVAAMRIRDQDVGDMVGGAGAVLCVFGLLYGGFWRARMRRKFGIRGGSNTVGCGSPSLAGYLQWMFCWGCVLAQEVRTGNLLVEDVEASREGSGGGQVDSVLQPPLPRENEMSSVCQAGSTTLATEEAVAVADSVPPPAMYSPNRGDELPFLDLKQERSSSSGGMRPPVPPSMPEGERRV